MIRPKEALSNNAVNADHHLRQRLHNRKSARNPYVSTRSTMHRRPSRCWILGIDGPAGSDLPGTHDEPLWSVSNEVEGIASHQSQRLFIVRRGENADFGRIDDTNQATR